MSSLSFLRKARWLAVVLAAAPAAAQTAPQPVAATAAAPSDSAMVNLVRLLVEQGVLSREKGDALMRQAETEAAQARTAGAATQQALAPPPAGAIRVPYVPETVRAQIRDELKQEVLAQAKAEGWAAPANASPDWVRGIRLSGDIRVRSQSELYSNTNSNLIPNFARINQIGPIPIFEQDTFIPLLNTREDRATRLQLRARLNLDAQISDQLKVGFQLATGQDNSPISTSDILGGGFAKRDIWLQSAYIDARPTEYTRFLLGRFYNPFMYSEMVFDNDLALDGVYAELNSSDWLGDRFAVTLRGGAFPLDFGDPNFVETDVQKRDYPERWMFSGQAELSAKFGEHGRARLAAAYHSYTNIQANLSDPCFIYRVQAEFRNQVICSTDNERALFLRKGNTVIPIRDVVLDVPPPVVNEVRVSPQFVGLALDYDLLNITGQVTVPIADEIDLTAAGDFVKNLSFKRSDLCRFGPTLSAAYPPLNNVGADGNGNVCAATNASRFVGGDTGYQGMLTVGHRDLNKRGAWRVFGGYRHLESDAVLDSFADSNMFLGGTNYKGYFVGARGYLMKNSYVQLRWYSANEIAAEPLSIDVLQIDVGVAF